MYTAYSPCNPAGTQRWNDVVLTSMCLLGRCKGVQFQGKQLLYFLFASLLNGRQLWEEKSHSCRSKYKNTLLLEMRTYPSRGKFFRLRISFYSEGLHHPQKLFPFCRTVLSVCLSVCLSLSLSLSFSLSLRKKRKVKGNVVMFSH